MSFRYAEETLIFYFRVMCLKLFSFFGCQSQLFRYQIQNQTVLINMDGAVLIFSKMFRYVNSCCGTERLHVSLVTILICIVLRVRMYAPKENIMCELKKKERKRQRNRDK